MLKLLESGRIGKLSLKNRVVMAAMGIGSLAEPDGRVSERVTSYYVARAKGGTGLIISCGFRPSREIEQPPGIFFGRRLMLDNDVYVARLNLLAEAVHDYGAKIFIQLATGSGRNNPPEMLKMVGAVGSSPNPAFFDPSITTRPLTTEEVEQLVKSHEVAARLARAAGVDGVELNCHGGYLFDEFTSPLWNKRTDKYGGNLDGRLRFSLETIEAVKKGAGPDFPISIKFALTHRIPGSREVDEGLEIARRWEAAGVDALDIDSGCYEVRYWCDPPTTLPMGCNVDLAAMVKKAVRIPVFAVGKLGDPVLAERVLAEGKADFIALARPLLADPEWVNKVREGRPEDICPCIGDLEGCHKRTSDRKYLSCTVNPVCGMENNLVIEPAERKKTVLVVGGGPGGMEAARVAALRGHRVTLWERDNKLGGHLIAASVPDFKQEYRTLINYLSTQIEKVGVEVYLAREATPELVERMKPEVVFIATGGTPVYPEIPGVKGKNVVQAVDLLLGRCTVGESVVVIGGGVVGCETALFLAQKGKKVTVVEALERVMYDMYSISRGHLEKLLADNNVKTLTGVRVLRITAKGVSIEKNGSRDMLEVDSVVLAVGLAPSNRLLEALKDKVPEVYSIGDCVQPRRVINAIWEGFRTARLV